MPFEVILNALKCLKKQGTLKLICGCPEILVSEQAAISQPGTKRGTAREGFNVQ